MPLTAAGPLAVAMESLRTLISNIAFFQTWVGAGSASAALTSILSGEVGYPIQSVQIVSNVLTVKTRDTHTIQVGDTVTLEGAAIGAESEVSITGAYTVLSVTANAFTVSKTASDVDETELENASVLPGTRPFVVIAEDDNPLRMSTIGGQGTVIASGELDIILEANVSTAYQNDPSQALMEARNAVGQFHASLMQLAGTADYMYLTSGTITHGPLFINIVEQDDNTKRYERWRAIIRVGWGLEG